MPSHRATRTSAAAPVPTSSRATTRGASRRARRVARRRRAGRRGLAVALLLAVVTAVPVVGSRAGRAAAGPVAENVAAVIASSTGSASATSSPTASGPRASSSVDATASPSARPSTEPSATTLKAWGLDRADDIRVAGTEDAADRAAARSSCSAGADDASLVTRTYHNGDLPDSLLCKLWTPKYRLRLDAGAALWRMNAAYREETGKDLCLADAYRSLSSQRSVAATRGGFAATPGKSFHGLGVAVDFCGGVATGGGAYPWLTAHAAEYGWGHPLWARAGGAGPYEPWHWEYFAGETKAQQLERAGHVVD